MNFEKYNNDEYLKKNVKETFISDFSKEKNISIEKAKGILNYVLTNTNIIIDSLELESYENDYEIVSIFQTLTYDNFLSVDYNLYKETYEKIFLLMENVLNLFKVMEAHNEIL